MELGPIMIRKSSFLKNIVKEAVFCPPYEKMAVI